MHTSMPRGTYRLGLGDPGGRTYFGLSISSVELAALDSASVPQMRRLEPEARQVTKYALRLLPCHKQSCPLATSIVQRDNAGSLCLLWGNPIPDNEKCRGPDCPAKYKQAGHQPNYVLPRCSRLRCRSCLLCSDWNSPRADSG